MKTKSNNIFVHKYLSIYLFFFQNVISKIKINYD